MTSSGSTRGLVERFSGTEQEAFRRCINLYLDSGKAKSFFYREVVAS